MSKERKEQQYFTAEGTPTKLHDLVRAEPEWATSRIRALELAIERIAELEAQLARQWQPIDQFSDSSYEGWCWIVNKGRVVEAYRDRHSRFLFSKWSTNCYMTECITYVMEWANPEAPEVSE